MNTTRWIDRASSLALVPYPAPFRQRSAGEMRRDFDGRPRTGLTVFWSGLAERVSAINRFLFWPNHRPHLYMPSGRHAMFWDTLRSDLQHTIRLAAKTPLVTTL